MIRDILKIVVLCVVAVCWQRAGAQYSAYYHQRAALFEELPTSPQDIIFLGNSITDGGEWTELLGNPNAKNRGISGDVTMGVLDRLGAITRGRPAKVFLLIGTNDISRGIAPDSVARNIEQIVRQIRRDSPHTEVFVQSILPVTPSFDMFHGHTSRLVEVQQTNALLQETAGQMGAVYIDLYTHFIDPATGEMDRQYTNDGLHLLGRGYLLWAEIIKPYIK